MQISQNPSSNPSPTKKQLIVIFFLCTTLFVGIIIKVSVDYHWWLPKTEIVSLLHPEDMKAKLDINNAHWYELVLLPSLGESKARAIVAYREKYGCFSSMDELGNVNGIGTVIIETVKKYVKIGSCTTARQAE